MELLISTSLPTEQRLVELLVEKKRLEEDESLAVRPGNSTPEDKPGWPFFSDI